MLLDVFKTAAAVQNADFDYEAYGSDEKFWGHDDAREELAKQRVDLAAAKEQLNESKAKMEAICHE